VRAGLHDLARTPEARVGVGALDVALSVSREQRLVLAKLRIAATRARARG
jgi:hypothetical protein